MSNINIRTAKIDDIPQIHALVCELAAFEKASSEVTTTPKSYIKDFNDNTFECLVAEEQNIIVGIALYYFTFSTWKGKMIYLEDFVVLPDQRGKGIGQLLFNALIKEAKNQKINRIKWQVLDWNQSAIDFYKKYNADFDKEWWNGYIYT